MTETWVYLGTRLDRDKKAVHAWRDNDGETRIFGKLKAAVVGGGYTIDVERRDDGGVTVSPSTLSYIGACAADLDAIVLEHRAALKALEAARLERSTARRDVLEDAIAPLLELASRTQSHAGKAALVEYVTRRIYEQGRSRS